MEITVEIDEDKLEKMVMETLASDIAKRMMSEFHTGEKYCYHRVIKDVVREVIKKDIDNLSDRAIKAASTSITNKGLKKISTEELLARIAGRDGE